MKIDPLMAIDFYKAGHIYQYPPGTTLVYSNMTARSAKHAHMLPDYDNKIVFFGLQYFVRSFLIDCWTENFFKKPLEEVLAKYKRRMDTSLGEGVVGTEHIEKLHKLGYLPLIIKALPEGSRVPIGVPFLTIFNTHAEFFWLTNYIETVMSSYLWKPITSATIAFEYRRLLDSYADMTGSDREFVKFQAHDFSFRGMSGPEDAALSGAGHLTSFKGTDSVIAIDLIEEYYCQGVTEQQRALVGPIGCSVPATEHSVMCMGMEEGEIDTFKRLLESYPKGILSIVSDTWDFWRVVTEYMRTLKDQILQRDGKIVVRPDSGDPVDIICGDPLAPKGSPEYQGAVECLWEIFGGTFTEKGYKVLDSHIGLIYGDSITLDRARIILERLEEMGFASSNIVFGVGSFTYQHVTRDTFGFAIKATYGEVNDVPMNISKNPKTDTGEKKSAKGLLQVIRLEKDGDYSLVEDCDRMAEKHSELQIIFANSCMQVCTSYEWIRLRVEQELINAGSCKRFHPFI